MLGFRPTQAPGEIATEEQEEMRSGSTGTTRHTVFQQFSDDAETLMPKTQWWLTQTASETRNANSTLLVEAMASCTAITYVNGKLVGDPLDVQMFESTNWVLDESHQVKSGGEDGDQLIIAYTHP